jgi:hypothetical protein
VLSSGLYAIPALVGAALVVAADSGGVNNVLGVPVTLAAALVCSLIRVVGLHFDLDAPKLPRDWARGVRAADRGRHHRRDVGVRLRFPRPQGSLAHAKRGSHMVLALRRDRHRAIP